MVVDDELVERVMEIYGLPTKRSAIDFALRRAVGGRSKRDALKLKGIGWEGDLMGMRRARGPEP